MHAYIFLENVSGLCFLYPKIKWAELRGKALKRNTMQIAAWILSKVLRFGRVWIQLYCTALHILCGVKGTIPEENMGNCPANTRARMNIREVWLLNSPFQVPTVHTIAGLLGDSWEPSPTFWIPSTALWKRMNIHDDALPTWLMLQCQHNPSMRDSTILTKHHSMRLFVRCKSTTLSQHHKLHHCSPALLAPLPSLCKGSSKLLSAVF